MYGELSRLSGLAEVEIDALKEDGIDVTPEQIVKINACCKMIETPSMRMRLAAGHPVEIGGESLWPLTIYGSDWYMRHENEFRSETDKLIALAFSMAHGRDELPEWDVKRTVKRWRKSLKCRLHELGEAVSLVLEQDEEPPNGSESEASGESMGSLSAMLVAHCGGDPDMWERQCSLHYANAVLSMKLSIIHEEDGNRANKMVYEIGLAELIRSIRNGQD